MPKNKKAILLPRRTHKSDSGEAGGWSYNGGILDIPAFGPTGYGVKMYAKLIDGHTQVHVEKDAGIPIVDFKYRYFSSSTNTIMNVICGFPMDIKSNIRENFSYFGTNYWFDMDKFNWLESGWQYVPIIGGNLDPDIYFANVFATTIFTEYYTTPIDLPNLSNYNQWSDEYFLGVLGGAVVWYVCLFRYDTEGYALTDADRKMEVNLILDFEALYNSQS